MWQDPTRVVGCRDRAGRRDEEARPGCALASTMGGPSWNDARRARCGRSRRDDRLELLGVDGEAMKVGAVRRVVSSQSCQCWRNLPGLARAQPATVVVNTGCSSGRAERFLIGKTKHQAAEQSPISSNLLTDHNIAKMSIVGMTKTPPPPGEARRRNMTGRRCCLGERDHLSKPDVRVPLVQE